MPRIEPPAEPTGRGVSLSRVRGDALLPVRPNTPFLLFHLPKNWFVGEVEVNGKRVQCWLPKLKPLPLQPGANGVGEAREKGGPADYLAAEKRIRRLHGVLLDGQEQVAVYLREHDCRDPKTRRRGLYFCTTWDNPVGVNGELRTRFDAAGHNAWLLSLVTSGVIAPPDEAVIEELRERLSSRLSRLGGMTHVPAMKAALKEEQERERTERTALIPSRQMAAEVSA